jgi:hypothetical protein
LRIRNLAGRFENWPGDLPRRRRDQRFFRIPGTTFAVERLYPVNIGMIKRSRVINVAGGIGADGCYEPPRARARDDLFFALRGDFNLVTALDDEVALVVRIVGPGEVHGVGSWISERGFACLGADRHGAADLDAASVASPGGAAGGGGVTR